MKNISWWSGESIALKLWVGNVLRRQQQVRLEKALCYL